MSKPTAARREASIQSARNYVRDGRFEADLARRVAIPTESQRLPESAPHLARYLEAEMGPSLAALGFACTILPNARPGGPPVLIASRMEDAGLPTVLGYGHGDVVDGMAGRWTKGDGPWRTARDGDRLYGRGTADNKAQHTLNIAALAAVMAVRGGRLGFNAKYLIEMGEEVGSIGLRDVIAANRDLFSADVLIASDGPRARPDLPTLTLGCRGAINFDLVCDLRAGGHHSGNWGGLIANPAVILAAALASIVGRDGALKVEGLKAPPMSAAVKAALAGLEVDGGPGAPAIDTWWGEPGHTPAERVYASNVFNVLALGAGDAARPVNAIPPAAVARCQLRFVAGTDVAGVRPALERHLAAHGFTSVRVTDPPASNDGTFEATRTEPDDPWVTWAAASIAQTAGRPPAIIPQTGGSICNELFTDLLGMATLWVPHSYPACSQHAPDEHILMPLSESAIALMAGLYWDLGEPGVPPRRNSRAH